MALFRRGGRATEPELDDAGLETSAVEDPAVEDPAVDGDSTADGAVVDDAAGPGRADQPDDDPDDSTSTAAPAGPAWQRTDGPWDAAEDADDQARLDLGGLLLPSPPGLTVRMDTDAQGRVIQVRVEAGGSELQLAPFAAPRTEGIWDEIRTEIADQITADGGTVDDVPGDFGRELLARVQVRDAEGRTGRRTVRFVGVDGPRWFLRGVLTGPAAVEPDAARLLESVFRGCVVVRGDKAMPPRDLLPMRLPDQARAGAPPAPEAESFDPLTRGPEMTETR